MPVGLNSNMGTMTDHDREMIETFEEGFWSYPSTWYVDPREPPGPDNALVPHYYWGQDMDEHLQRLDQALEAYHGQAHPYLAEPRVTVLEPRDASFSVAERAEVRFAVEPPGSGVQLTWRVNGTDVGTGVELTHGFAPTRHYTVELVVDEGSQSKTLTWLVNP